ncbi:TetR/AcrR family transcriptional regulator [Roseomonas aerophila]|uniref:TetR/AcrR family transcriptional regulator n=1 Tax=Teichococcus aerophilus TaxID=1224513 RepID=A0ABR7RNT6_9PROT|nr:TetR/AcrR family transcriptional regulator [Pseudoroseomonas aerophila]MBC9208003.1 TetR/AcrR family transcriptional regulator [Pseudoroseomonas aerophila]
MRVSREQAGKNREDVIAVASQLFRERGFDGVGIADIMKAAGLTHGGFYGQFQSKQHLAAEASKAALEKTRLMLAQVAAQAGARGFDAIVEFYLSGKPSQNPARGCPVPALGADAARAGGAVQAAFEAGVEGYVTLLAEAIAAQAGGTAASRRPDAMAAFAAMVGALTLSRAVGDPDLAAEIRQSCLRDLQARVATARLPDAAG